MISKPYPTLPATFVVFALALAGGPATAAGPFYLSGAVGNTDAGFDASSAIDQLVDGEDNSWSVGVGFKLGERLVFEGVYHDFGEFLATQTCPSEACLALFAPLTVDSTALTISFLPHLPITDEFALYGRLGLASWETDISEALDGLPPVRDLSGEDLVYGAGLRMQLIGPLGAFVEYTRVADVFDTLRLGATFGY